MGIPTVCYIRDDLHYLPFSSPIINSNPNLIKNTIIRLYNNSSELKTAGSQAYEYCKATHSPALVAKFLLYLYQKIEAIPLDPTQAQISEYEMSFVQEYINSISSDNKNSSPITENPSLFLKALRHDTQSNNLMAIFYYSAHLVVGKKLSYVDKDFVVARINQLRRKSF